MQKKKMKNPEEQSHCLASAETAGHIHVGSFYELDHSKLPLTASEHVNYIRVVLVDGKSLSKVSVRFPSLHSLQAHLNKETYPNPNGFFDQTYSMAPETASEVLYRRLPHPVIAEQGQMWSFWAAPVRFAARKSPSPCCLSELNGMLQWGKRKLIKCVTMRESPSSSGKNEEAKTEEEEIEISEDGKESRYEFRKRKGIQKKPKTAKRQKQRNEIVIRETQNQLVGGFIERWTARRYKAAEEKIVKVMIEKGVCAENPIRRAPLRAEARKLIGDTGLIDHLLKHMAGKVAPGGTDRFRRRHNGDGALEYWLESADLMRIREEAGVVDPYWIPPPGWKIGDNPTQDPICVRMFKEVWEEIGNLKGEREKKFQPQEDLVTASHSLLTALDQGQASSSVINLEHKYREFTAMKSRIEEQLRQLSPAFSGIEEQMKSLQEELRGLKPPMEESAVIYSETGEVPMLISDIGGGTNDKMRSRDKANKEEKAAKIERLRSSFRLCKPQGTFMWPDMSITSKGGLQQADNFLVPTPPSVSSSNKSAIWAVFHTPDGHSPSSPLKPLAVRQAFDISSLSNVTKSPEKTKLQSQFDSISIGEHDINLNQFPDAYDTDSTKIPGLTYQGEHQNSMKAKNIMEHDTDHGKDFVGYLRYNTKHHQR